MDPFDMLGMVSY